MKRIPSIWSFMFPIGISIYSGYQMIRWGTWGLGLAFVAFKFPWVYAAALIIGGILPIILTLALRIETREYLLPRLIIYLCTVAAISIFREFVSIPQGGLVILCAVSAAITLLYFYQFHKTRFSEWCMIFLTTPQIYMMLYYLLLENDILDSIA